MPGVWGINIKKTRFIIIFVTSFACRNHHCFFVGPIALYRNSNPPTLPGWYLILQITRSFFPMVILNGAILMLACDIIAQVPGQEYTLPINAVTSVFGAPIVIWLVIRRKNFSKSFAN